MGTVVRSRRNPASTNQDRHHPIGFVEQQDYGVSCEGTLFTQVLLPGHAKEQSAV
jgi:hypothetical protein